MRAVANGVSSAFSYREHSTIEADGCGLQLRAKFISHSRFYPAPKNLERHEIGVKENSASKDSRLKRRLRILTPNRFARERSSFYGYFAGTLCAPKAMRDWSNTAYPGAIPLRPGHKTLWLRSC